MEVCWYILKFQDGVFDVDVFLPRDCSPRTVKISGLSRWKSSSKQLVPGLFQSGLIPLVPSTGIMWMTSLET